MIDDGMNEGDVTFSHDTEKLIQKSIQLPHYE